MHLLIKEALMLIRHYITTQITCFPKPQQIRKVWGGEAH